MIDLAILYVLAVIDGMFVGYRDAAGRNPKLDKRRYYLRAMLIGVGLVHLAMLVIAAVVMLSFWWAADTAAVFAAQEDFAATLRVVYLAYTGFVALTFCAYALPSYDLRSYVSVGLFGILTLVRPMVIIVGAIIAAVLVNELATWATCLAIVVTMGGLQPALDRLGWNQFDWSGYASVSTADAPAADGST